MSTFKIMKKDIKMVLKYSLIVRGMQIKATMRYHFSPIRLAKAQKLDNILKFWGNRKSHTFLVECNYHNLYGKEFGNMQ